MLMQEPQAPQNTPDLGPVVPQAPAPSVAPTPTPAEPPKTTAHALRMVVVIFGVVLIFFILTVIFAVGGVQDARDALEEIEQQNRQTELGDGWRGYRGDHFTAEFPAEVVTASEVFPSDIGDIKLETLQAASEAGSAFTITVLTVDSEETELEESIRNAVAAGAETGGGTLIDEQYYPLENGIAKAYYKVRFIEEGASQEALLIATKERFYQVIVVYETGAEPQEHIDRFLAAFKLN